MGKDKFSKFKSTIDYLSNIFIEANFVYTDGTFKIAEIGGENALGIEVTFKKIFDGFSVSEDNKHIEFGVLLPEFKKAISRCKEDVIIKFGDLFEIIGGKKRYKVPVIEMYDKKNFKLPELKDIKVSFEIELSELKEMLEDVNAISGDAILFTTKEKKLFFSSENYKNSKCEGEIELDVKENLQEIKSKFGTKFLSDMFLKIPFEKAKINLGDDYPLLSEFEDEELKIEAILAPRISNED